MTSLLEHIFKELDAELSSNGVKICLSYDVTCTFGQALCNIMPEYADRIDCTRGSTFMAMEYAVKFPTTSSGRLDGDSRLEKRTSMTGKDWLTLLPLGGYCQALVGH